MRFMILGCAAALVLSSVPAMAVENFIPQGHAYAPGEDGVPPIGSEQDRMNAQTDVYETEAYFRALRLKQNETRLNRLLSDQEIGPQDDNRLDY